MTVAASFDRDLIAKRAEAIAEEFVEKGVNIWLGPVTGGPLGRAARGGRNWEGESTKSIRIPLCFESEPYSSFLSPRIRKR